MRALVTGVPAYVRHLLTQAISAILEAALTTVNLLTRYCRYVVLGLLVPGVPLLITAASKLFLNPHPDRFWVVLEDFAAVLCSAGLLIWLCLIISRIGSDVMKLWKQNKTGFLGAVGGIAMLAVVLEHLYASSRRVGKADAIVLFWLELFVGSYLLLRTSVFLTGAKKN